jgi:hypothetical protein
MHRGTLRARHRHLPPVMRGRLYNALITAMSCSLTMMTRGLPRTVRPGLRSFCLCDSSLCRRDQSRACAHDAAHGDDHEPGDAGVGTRLLQYFKYRDRRNGALWEDVSGQRRPIRSTICCLVAATSSSTRCPPVQLRARGKTLNRLVFAASRDRSILSPRWILFKTQKKRPPQRSLHWLCQIQQIN